MATFNASSPATHDFLTSADEAFSGYREFRAAAIKLGEIAALLAAGLQLGAAPQLAGPLARRPPARLPKLDDRDITLAYTFFRERPSPATNDPLANDEPFATEDFFAAHFVEMEKGRQYFKRDRSTSITVGVCNGREFEINRTDGGARYRDNEQPYILSN